MLPLVNEQWWGWRLAWAAVVTITVVAALSILTYGLFLGPNPWRDGDAYLNAAMRVRAGEPLYPQLADPHGPTVYRYAPWFAYAWIPLSYLPREVIIWLWQLAMLACSALAVLPAWRSGPLGRFVVVIAIPFLVMASLIGNVQPAMVALIVYGIRSRAGPVAISVAASLKIVPLLYIVTYCRRRQWGSAALAVVLTVILWSPVLLVGSQHYPTEVGAVTSLWAISPALWAVALAVLLAAAFALARSRTAWYASSLLVALSPPRFIAYDWTYLLAGGASSDAPKTDESLRLSDQP